MLYRQFYSELGKLLYAIADVDGIITKQEKDKLLQIVKNELAPDEKDKDIFDTNSAFYTEFEFDILDDQVADPNVAYKSFIDFIDDHYTAFDERQKSAVVKVADELAAAFQGTGNKEKRMIDKLKNKMAEFAKSGRPKKKQKV